MINLNDSRCISNPIILTESEIKFYLAEIDTWKVDVNENNIHQQFSFKNYYQTLAFVNAVAWVVHQENHHPDINLSYNKCNISFSTHSVNGLTENDFICAAKINNLILINA